MYLSKRWLLLSKVFNHSSQRPGRIRSTRRRNSLNGCSRQPTHFCNDVEGLESRLLLSASTTTALAPVLNPKPPSPSVAEKSGAPSVAPTVSQTWTDMTNFVPNGDGGQLALLLSNGTLLVHGTNGNGGVSADWYQVTPDSTGGYINGIWSQAASMNVGRLYFGSVVLPNGNVFVVGGEYATDGTFNGQQELSHSAEIYNPATNTWTFTASDPQTYVGDEPTELLSNGNVLVGNIFNNSAEIYNPTTNTWSTAGTKVHNDRSDEEPWVKLPNGDILTYDLFSSISDNKFEAELYNPTTNSWSDVSSNTLPILTTPSQGYELGPALLLPDGRALFTGATGLTAFFDPTTNSWTQGPTMPSVSINNVQTQLTAGDAPGAILPNGDVLLALSPAVNGGNFPGPTYIYDFNPVTGAYTNVTPSSNVDPNLGYNSYINTMLVLPTGQVLLINDNDQLAIYTPDGAPNAAWQPTITSFTNNGDGSYTLTGTQLNGLDEGAAYGDDNQMAENYPIVQVSDITSGHVYYATTSNWSSTGVATGNTPETVNVVLPASLGIDPYTLKVIANGIASNAFSPSQSPPTITAPATASVNQNTSLTFTGGNAITVSDPSGTSEQLTLMVSQGTLSLGTTTGLTVTGNGTGTVALVGSLSSLNSDLASLTYTPTVGYNGPDTLSLSDKDTADSLTGTASVSITVAPLAPSITAPATASVNENGTLAFTGGNAISVTDPSGTSEQLTLMVSQGALSLGTTTGLTVTGNGAGTLTLTGALSDLNNDLASLTYSPTAGYNGSDILSLSNEDTSNGLTAAASVGLTVNALAPPTITAPATASLNENGSLVFSTANGDAISITDPAAGSNSDSLTLSVAHGTLTLASTSGLTFTAGANGSASFTVSGTVASLNTALNGLTYQPTAGYVGSDSLAVSITDPGDSLSASTSVALTVSILPPAITAPATAALAENSSLVFSSGNGNAISFTDVNAGTGKTESLSLSVTHGTLTLGTTNGLTFTSGKNNSDSLTATGTVTALNAALSGLTYKPTAAYFGPDSLAISVSDSLDHQSSSTSVALTVNALSAPTISAPGSASVGENLSVSFSTANGNAISVADANAGTKFDTLTLSVTNGTLTLGATPGLSFKSGKNGTASFSIAATLANLNTALNGLTYKPTIGYSGPDSISVSILDPGDGQSASTSVSLTVNPATAPVITAPASASVTENATQVFSSANGNTISFTDANAGTSKMESLTLSVAHGTVKLGTTFGLTVTAGSNNSATMTVTGTVTNLNAALNGLTYKPATGYIGSDSLAVSVSDPGDGLSASTSVALTVAVAPPAFTAPASASVAQNGSLVFSSTNNNQVRVTDVNAGTAIEQVTLSATNGKLKLGATTGITFNSGANNSSAMTISGTLTNLNNALKNLTFTPTTGYNGSAAIALGYTDTGNGLGTSANIAITVGTGAAAVSGGLTTPTATVSSGRLQSPSWMTTGSTGDGTTDADTQWAGFAAAMDTLNS
jgi:hypothetical protein